MRHLLDTRTLAKDDAMLILDTAEDMAATQQREVKKLPTLRGKTVVNLFYEDSTRTRISFEAAAKRLARVLWNDPGTGVMRHADAGYEIAKQSAHDNHLNLPMLNA